MRVKESSAILLSVLLLSMSISENSESFAVSIQEQKLEIIDELKEIKENSEINKKSKNKIDKAISKLEKSLNEKYWSDESLVNFKHGKKVINADLNAVKTLDKILKDKKIRKTLKQQIIEINLKITHTDKTLLENSIDSLNELILGDKGTKK